MVQVWFAGASQGVQECSKITALYDVFESGELSTASYPSLQACAGTCHRNLKFLKELELERSRRDIETAHPTWPKLDLDQEFILADILAKVAGQHSVLSFILVQMLPRP